MAFSLGLDFDRLNEYLGQTVCTHTTTTSILSLPERNKLPQLSLMIQRLRHEAQSNERHSMVDAEKQEAYGIASVLEAEIGRRTIFTGGFCTHALDLIGSYADHAGDPAKWRKSALGHWSRLSLFADPLRFELRHTLVYHDEIFDFVSPNEQVRHMFGMALEGYQRQRKMGDSFGRRWKSSNTRDRYKGLHDILKKDCKLTR